MSATAPCQPTGAAARSAPARLRGAAAMHRGVQQQATALRRPAAAAARRHLQPVRAAAEQPVSVATSSTDEDRVPPGCSRYTVSLPKPLGLVLEEGPGGRGVFVAEIADKGNAAALAPEISVGDELVATNGLTFTTEQRYQDNIVKGGETYVRVNVRANNFQTVMAAIGSIKPPQKVVLEFQRCQQ